MNETCKISREKPITPSSAPLGIKPYMIHNNELSTHTHISIPRAKRDLEKGIRVGSAEDIYPRSPPFSFSAFLPLLDIAYDIAATELLSSLGTQPCSVPSSNSFPTCAHASFSHMHPVSSSNRTRLGRRLFSEGRLEPSPTKWSRHHYHTWSR